MKRRILAVICTVVMLIGMVGCRKSFDASGYVKGYLDTTMKGEYEEYAKLCQVENSEAEKIYNDGVDTILTGWTTGLTIGDDMKERYRQLIIEILKSSKYTVKEAKKDGESYKVEVAIEPMVLDMSTEKAAKLGEDTAKEYMKVHKKVDNDEFYALLSEKYYDFLVDMKDNATYEAEETVEVTVAQGSDKKYTISQEEQKKLISTVMKTAEETK